ncbi:MAG: SUMF1/EgtB/PvdO family nonheme iron enzyme [Thiothrix sp.]|uniref:SUMF1/EgtB/PvdO family nonheme iron enzyme n=1 Tax=Thiothrix sp. TaxID=1032 RepID=UPI0026275184|nr:SUMF1/EgtB/PvdO family nonheme iron enzyme [Thiothrix sp.]MDD5392319.1 SUMF1/EgtB/PvdO family nonheme iron enzyme [Thiothrix sp.]
MSVGNGCSINAAFSFANALIISHILRRVGATRGGSWNNTSDNVRCAIRNRNHPNNRNNNIGFRVVLGE